MEIIVFFIILTFLFLAAFSPIVITMWVISRPMFSTRHLVQELGSPDYKRKAKAFNQLVTKKRRRALKPLIKALQDVNPDVRKGVVEALGQIGDSAAVEPLIETLKDPSVSVRREAITALLKLGDLRATSHLIPLLEHEDHSIRWRAAEAIGALKDVQAVNPLIEHLQDMDRNVRVKVAQALGLLGDAKAVEPLSRALGDMDADVRRCAAEALGHISDVRAVAPLCEALKDAESGVRWRAAEALGKLSDVRALAPLRNVLHDPNLEVRQKGVKAIGEIDHAEAVDLLVEALRDTDGTVRHEAAMALAKFEWSTENVRDRAYYLAAKGEWEGFVAWGVPVIEILNELFQVQHRDDRDLIAETLKEIYAVIKTVIFGTAPAGAFNRATTLVNPDVAECHLPMSRLQNIIIYTGTHDFQLVERFLTYAVNHIGQKHLNDHVEAHIYDDPDKLHPNLRNTLTNLCKCVDIHEDIQRKS